MLLDILFYVTMYISLFVSVFWLMVYFGEHGKRAEKSRALPLTIVIPTYNKGHLIGKTVESLEKQHYRGLKIIVVDDGSTDDTGDTVKMLMEKHRNMEYFRKKNTGKASSLNFGLRKVRTPYFGFIDSDTYLSRNVLAEMVSHFTGNVACVTAAIKPANERNFVEKIQKIEYTISSLTRKLMSLINALYFTPAFAIYKTGVIKKLGGFDENNITEDLEIGLRLKSKGHDIYNSLRSVVYTDVPKTFREFFRQRMRWYRGHIYNTIKYSDMIFNRRFGDLGMLVLPVQYVIFTLTTVMLFYGLYDFLTILVQRIIDFSLIGLDLDYTMQNFTFSLVTPTTSFILLLLASFIVILKLSEKKTHEKIRNMEYVVYIATYPFINIFLWITAFVQEVLLKTRKRW